MQGSHHPIVSMGTKPLTHKLLENIPHLNYRTTWGQSWTVPKQPTHGAIPWVWLHWSWNLLASQVRLCQQDPKYRDCWYTWFKFSFHTFYLVEALKYATSPPWFLPPVWSPHPLWFLPPVWSLCPPWFLPPVWSLPCLQHLSTVIHSQVFTR